jgi:hypothetical protein
VTEAEMFAQMRRIAAAGWSRPPRFLGPEEASEVCEFVIAECVTAGRPPDLRLLDNSCMDHHQWRDGNCTGHWHQLVSQRVWQDATHTRGGARAKIRRGAK